MKRTIGVFSLAMLLFSTFAPSFTYANNNIEVLEGLLKNAIYEEDAKLNNNSLSNNLSSYENLFVNNQGQNESNNHIIWDSEAGLIIIYSENFDYSFTLQDKDLGANNVGEYGDFYKWGFDNPRTTEGGDQTYQTNLNAWGGENDTYNKNETIVGGYDKDSHVSTNLISRKGPCAEGYHIPSAGERSELIKLYYKLKGIDLPNAGLDNDWTYEMIQNEEKYIEEFKNDLKIPYAGIRDNYDGSISRGDGNYWSSSIKYQRNAKRPLEFFINPRGEEIYAGLTMDPEAGLSIRCFKNQYIPKYKVINFNTNGGEFSGGETSKNITYNYSGAEIIPIYNIQIPNKEATGETGWMFDGWYTKSGDDNDWGEEFDMSNPNSTTAYAKWLPFNDLDLSIIGLTGVKIMDRNLGAEETADGTYYGYNNAGHEEYSMLGKYYQWGNNYGFKNNGTIEHSDNNPVDATSYGPKNYYMNNTFKTTSWSEAWTTESNENLWGGKEPKNPDTDKQGPCPEGYHVPDKLEWNLVYESFESKRKEEGSTLCDGFEENEKGKCFATKMLLPFAGKRGYTTQEYNHQGGCGYYWSSTPYDSDNSKYLSLDKNSIIANAEAKRSYGYSVRCFKNSSNKLTLNTDNGEDIINVRRWEEIGEYLKDIYYKGYKILGWYYDANQSIEINNSDIIKENKKIYAKWERNPWYTYNSNNGIFSDGHNERIIKSDLVKTVVTIENQKDVLRTNYFKGASSLSIGLKILNWDPGLDDKIDIYTGDSENGNPYKVISPECYEYYGCIYYYEFEIPSDTITIVIHGSTANENTSYSATINANGADPYKIDKFEETPTRQGYKFSGWYEGTTGENNELIIADEEFNFEDTSVIQDRTLYAKWNPHHYTIKFNVNGGTGEAEDINATYGTGTPLPTVTREGYNFEGWLSNIDNNIYSGTIEEGTGLTSEDNVIVNLTAQWKSIPVEPEEQTVSSAGGGATINSSKQESKTIEQEHDSADLEKIEVEEVKSTQTTTSPTIKENVKKIEGKSLTRGEVAVMTNILLNVYPQLTENKSLNEVSKACENYADEQNFTKDEKKAITRLCKLSIMGIHKDTKEPLDEFLAKQKSTNGEFATVMDRVVGNYTEKDLSVVKDALKKLENNEEGVVFGTVYDVFMSIKNIFN